MSGNLSQALPAFSEDEYKKAKMLLATQENISSAIMRTAKAARTEDVAASPVEETAQPIRISREAFEIFKSVWDGVSDEHRAQLFLEALHEADQPA